ncbi:DUF3054 domain-containing protein [Pseudokineococcus basanitobsidens]|uniref:DUF3054 domain-containing protein n=1 Tax=Pseudokineococcus basanitobsidens TaxID=1926649 RepID=A0ABU8RJ01_9ACTN
MSRRSRRAPSRPVVARAGGTAPARPPAAALVVDLLAVLVFAGVGRSSHAEGTGLLQVAGTALPFWVGVVLAWAVPRVHRDPTRLVPAGAVVLAGSVVVGVVLRLATGQGAPVSFVVVTVVVLAVLLLGWRALARWSARRAAVR